jgi:hypothetical protein
LIFVAKVVVFGMQGIDKINEIIFFGGGSRRNASAMHAQGGYLVLRAMAKRQTG